MSLDEKKNHLAEVGSNSVEDQLIEADESVAIKNAKNTPKISLLKQDKEQLEREEFVLKGKLVKVREKIKSLTQRIYDLESKSARGKDITQYFKKS